MPSHRSPNFSRLKDLLPAISATQEYEDPDHPKDSEAQAPPSNQRSTNSLDQGEIQDTDDVQRNGAFSVSTRTSLVARPGKAKVITKPATFRLPLELQDALKSVADYNGLNMTDIVAESIWLHLQNFEWPPGSDEVRRKLRLLY